MTGLAGSPALLTIALMVLLFGSLVLMAWERKIPRRGDWLLGMGLLCVLVVAGIGWSELTDQAFAPAEWTRGWIGPKEESGSITIGVVRDAAALSMTVLAVLVASAVAIGAAFRKGETRPGRFYAALGLGATGVSVAWSASTPWFALMGCAISCFGGFLALGGLWDQADEAVLATRFAWERCWGLILALLGLCVLVGARAPLTMTMSVATTLGAQPAGSRAAWEALGAGLLFCGVFSGLQPFPLLGWVMRSSLTYAPARTLVAQVLPAWSFVALLIRLEPQLRAAGVFPDLGWLGLASAVLAAVAGILCGEWRLGVGAWLSSGFSLSVALLAFVGPAPAFCLMIGLGLGAGALSGSAVALEGEKGPAAGGSWRKRALWAKTGCFLSAAAGTGLLGFCSSGATRAISLAWQEPAVVGAIAAVFFLFVFQGWKVACESAAGGASVRTPWTAVLAPYALLVFALGLLWTGAPSGGGVPGSPDHLFTSLMGIIFGTGGTGATGGPGAAGGEAWGDEATLAPALALIWSLYALAAGFALWTAGRRVDVWPRVVRALPRFSAFVTSGYAVDRLLSRARAGLAWLGARSARVIDQGVWQQWMPTLLGRALRTMSSGIAAADLKLSIGIGSVLRSWIELPSRGLQIIQNGDVQWYLFFAVGSGVAILAHFMFKT